MALQIANPLVVEKIHTLARIMGMTKTAAVEKAVDDLLKANGNTDQRKAQMYALLHQFDRLTKAPNPAMDIEWGENGLPK